jgi:hypothetical protein
MSQAGVNNPLMCYRIVPMSAIGQIVPIRGGNVAGSARSYN